MRNAVQHLQKLGCHGKAKRVTLKDPHFSTQLQWIQMFSFKQGFLGGFCAFHELCASADRLYVQFELDPLTSCRVRALQKPYHSAEQISVSCESLMERFCISKLIPTTVCFMKYELTVLGNW